MIGVLGFGEDGKLAGKTLFPKNASKIAEKLVDIESGKLINEVTALVEELKKKGYTIFVFENDKLARAVQAKLDVEVEVKPSPEIEEAMQTDIGRYGVETGFLEESSEIDQWIHDVSMEMSRIKVKKATEKRDLLIVQAVQALDDVDKTLNLFSGRMREWYGLHFPEMDRLVKKHETYAHLVQRLGKRENFTEENLEKEGIKKNNASQLAKAAKTSMGADLYDKDVEQIQRLCSQILSLYDTRANLEKYIEEVMEEVAPNTSAFAGATLGARLIALAGGLENLAKMPTSTMQVLGAEKALFRSLKTGARPPKHGIIFQHALIHGSKRRLRGKIARAFAGKLAIAVRTDAFSAGFAGDKLKEQLQERIEEIEKKYPEKKRSEKKSKKDKGQSKAMRRRRKEHGRKR